MIHWAELLKSSPVVACTFINAADVQIDKLKDFDALVFSDRQQKSMWRAVIPLIESF